MEAGNKSEKHALLFGLAAVTLWSTVATGFKLGLQVLAVEQLLLLGSLISWCIFLCYAAVNRTWRIADTDRRLVIGLGLINPLAYYLILFAAYDRLPAHIAQPLNYTWAITLALLAVPLLKQTLSARQLTGICVSYSGVVVLLVTSSSTQAGGWDLLGVALALASTVLWALYWLLNTRSESPPAAMMFWSFSVALPGVALICYVGPGWPPVNLETLAYGAWVGAIEMGITFILWQQALRRTNQTARIGQLIFLSPFLSLIMIYLVLDEQVGWGAFFALIIIVTGLQISRSTPSISTASTPATSSPPDSTPPISSPSSSSPSSHL